MSFRSAITFSLFSALAMSVAILVLGCGFLGAKAPDERAIARGAVYATAEAVKAADEACATVGAAKKDLVLLTSCERHYDTARIALISTASAVDLWDRADTRQSVTCALADALAEVEAIGADLEKKGGKVPPIVDDARKLVTALGGCSRG